MALRPSRDFGTSSRGLGKQDALATVLVRGQPRERAWLVFAAASGPVRSLRSGCSPGVCSHQVNSGNLSIGAGLDSSYRLWTLWGACALIPPAAVFFGASTFV